ncbi:hypothetical protein Back11_39260 [Paenibacillus baekrokdamisoli]|uniref:Methyltransferase domain-containing protein n=1 Tax=Paenibacillus baekrokdamisoli TaxID=1712516 RepID=A0A3G9J9S0_9BACL|nr:methyltransferase domain-containing protein [Paenibacillus baekrokdamisoli]MBB3068374.1 ubiquinone/menaquinone biosynthesis C-methylase UbiE [Paenibacillus baekrokdamisoli]BBH22581.1 hypothetical protein Back11_39260 [Paenibacillus baekrokdamisoli]
MITKKFIDELGYTDFVGFINQWNVLPGAFTTISKWINYGKVNSDSRLLQVASTTGFQLRETATLTNCSGIGFDLSPYAVESARYNKETFSPNSRIEYVQCDGYQFQSDEKFSHILIGGGLKFFPDPQKMMDRCIEFLHDGGYILASPFFVTSEVPDEVLDRAKSVFGIRPTTESYKEIMGMYNKFEIIYEDKNSIEPETIEEIKYYCNCSTAAAVQRLNIQDKNVSDAIFNRLYNIKMMSNELRKYQGYSVLVLRFRKSIYPNRWVELF